jgi:hypothetical protein
MSRLTTEQRLLADLMSDISEEEYFAGWAYGLEHELWRALRSDDGRADNLVLSADRRRTLQALSDACGGWIVFDEAEGETWLQLDVWLARHAAHEADRNRRA